MRRFLLISAVCLFLAACSRPARQLDGSQPQTFAPLPAPAGATPDLRPPQPAEVPAAINRVYGSAVRIESARNQYFVMGDFNGDNAQDLAVVVRPADGKLAELNHELANWIRGDPQQVNLPDPKMSGRHARPLPAATQPVFIEQNDLLLAVIHGYGPSGWRHPQARQSYLLRHAVGDFPDLRPQYAASKLSNRPPQLRGDALKQTLAGEQGLLYYTGAHYAWHRLSPTKP